ncbi:MAG: hypothetical protein V9E83_14355 [Baekduia sp.]|mgnify:CR=1 FL=1
MVLAAVITFALALWLVLWALGTGGFTAFLIPAAIILGAIALRIARAGTASEE